MKLRLGQWQWGERSEGVSEALGCRWDKKRSWVSQAECQSRWGKPLLSWNAEWETSWWRRKSVLDVSGLSFGCVCRAIKSRRGPEIWTLESSWSSGTAFVLRGSFSSKTGICSIPWLGLLLESVVQILMCQRFVGLLLFIFFGKNYLTCYRKVAELHF